MQYIQLVEFNTNYPVDEVKQALDAWLETSRGKRTLHMAVVAADHDRPNHYWELLEYISEQDAAKTAELPETKAAFERWRAGGWLRPRGRAPACRPRCGCSRRA